MPRIWYMTVRYAIRLGSHKMVRRRTSCAELPCDNTGRNLAGAIPHERLLACVRSPLAVVLLNVYASHWLRFVGFGVQRFLDLVQKSFHPRFRLLNLFDRLVIQYAGAAPGYMPGVLQINTQMSPDVQAGNNVPVHITVGGVTSQDSVTLAVH